MKHWLIPCLVLGWLSVVTDVAVSQRIDATKFGWLANLDQGKAVARKSGKPIFLVFRCVP